MANAVKIINSCHVREFLFVFDIKVDVLHGEQ